MTHTISTSVIVFELTGQITHILPVMVCRIQEITRIYHTGGVEYNRLLEYTILGM